MKGGVGKTEVSLNLAAAIKKKTGKSVVVVDFDIPYGGVSQALAVDKDVTLTDWIKTNRIITKELSRSLVIETKWGFDIIPGVSSVYDISEITSETIKRIIGQLREFYDFVVIDSGVDFSEITKTALLNADKIIIVTTPSNVSVWNNHQYKEDLLTLGVDPVKVNLFLNQVPKKKQMDINIEKVIEIYEKSGVPIRTVGIAYYDDSIRKYRNKRQMIYIQKRKSDFAKAIDEILEEFGVTIMYGQDHKEPLFGSLKRLFGVAR